MQLFDIIQFALINYFFYYYIWFTFFWSNL